MGVLHFRYRERRRTLRVAMSLPVVVHGQNEMGEKFCVRAMTRSVNKQGALLAMDEPCYSLKQRNLSLIAGTGLIDDSKVTLPNLLQFLIDLHIRQPLPLRCQSV